MTGNKFFSAYRKSNLTRYTCLCSLCFKGLCVSAFAHASLRLISLTDFIGRGRLSSGFLEPITCFSKSCATEGFRLPPAVLVTLGMFLPEVSLRCCVRMGICRILLSPCGFGLFSDISLSDCRPLGGTTRGPLRSAIRHLSNPSEMAKNAAGWRENPELTHTRQVGQFEKM